MSEGDALRRAAVLIDTSRFADAIRELGAYLATNPGDGQALCLLARAHLGAGDPAAALDASNAAAHALPESDWPPRLASIAMMRQKRWSAAAWAAERAIQFSPNGWRSYLQRAQVDVASRHVTAAGRRAADKAVELAPQEAEVHVAMGNIELIQRRVGPARKSYLEALRIDPNNASARNNLSVVHLRQRRLLRSLTGFVAAARSNPRSELAIRNLTGLLVTLLWLFTLLLFWGNLFAYSQADQPPHNVRTVLVVIAAIVAGVAGLLWLFVRHRIGPGLYPLIGRALRANLLLEVWSIADALSLAMLVVGAGLPLRAAHADLTVACWVAGAGFVLGLVHARRLRSRRLRGRSGGRAGRR